MPASPTSTSTSRSSASPSSPDAQADWRPDTYAHDHWGCAVAFRYPLVKVLDWRGREAELATLPNPFAQVLLAQLAALTARDQVEPLAATWLAILRRLARAGYTYDQIAAVLTFLDRAIALPEEVERRIQDQLSELEGTAMPKLMSRWEAQAIEQGQRKGEEIGVQQGQQRIILAQLADQCGPLTDDDAARVRALSVAQLADLGRALLRFTGPADLAAWFAAHPTAAR